MLNLRFGIHRSCPGERQACEEGFIGRARDDEWRLGQRNWLSECRRGRVCRRTDGEFAKNRGDREGLFQEMPHVREKERARTIWVRDIHMMEM